MPKYDQKSLTDAAEAISYATEDTKEKYYPAGGSQYGSWPASTLLPAHEGMSLLMMKNPDTMQYETLDDFKPESWEVFLTKDFFTTFQTVYDSSQKAVRATAQQAGYGGYGLDRMAWSAKHVEDDNVTAVFKTLDKTQNRDG
ncbi:hypothetical protein [Actinoallomurus iriomotensis]|uniref:Uncharacterized protein n=1 Tax=Actinoallomurus iriomotensis TaxID=478107 RepID=A0A9W6W203_9ACTN|nr:hypothetical protein [Actinoallomurus iriomotensis]GLY87939.1 hypothetical protein Airi02_058680 [Actinoallomurus iriomotensis]